ncbi:MAG: peptidylprolyl isomerase [Flavobacteriales bacterium]
MKIEKGKQIALHYILKSDGPEGELIEETTTDEPMRFVMGEDPMLPKFEKAILGLSAGDKFTVYVAVEEAYGEEDESLYIEFPKETFIIDGELDEDLFEEGEVVPMKTEEGEEVMGVIAEVKLNTIIIDFNHPLAGENLYFEGHIVEVA